MYDKEHKQLVNIFKNQDLSPAGLSYKMVNESAYVNESLMQYMVNYIIIMATRHPDLIPPYLQNVKAWADKMYDMLDELNMTNAASR